MLEMFVKQSWTLARFRSGPVGHCLDSFAASLHEMGYGIKTGGDCLRNAVHLGRWAASVGLSIDKLDDRSIGDFEAHLPRCDYPFGRFRKHANAGKNARVFLRFLRAFGIARPAMDLRPPRLPVLVGFDDWMLRQRGATEATARLYSREILELIHRLGDDPSRYSARTLRNVVLDLVADRGASKASRVVVAMRAFLRYQAAIGRCSPDLVGAVPKVADWGQTSLPRHLPVEDVERLIGSCNEGTRPGLRDRAILLLLARLGLRAGDVTALRLSDIDWPDASIRVSGKGRRAGRLPLSQEVGDAILAYVNQGRPQAGPDQVFLAIGAPWRPLAGSSCVSSIVARAIRRAGIDAPTHGAHLLRHSAATTMLRQGASLYAIGTVLRHQSVESTAQYARVDTRMLLAVAQPWPDGAAPGDGGSFPAHAGSQMLHRFAQPWLEGESC